MAERIWRSGWTRGVTRISDTVITRNLPGLPMPSSLRDLVACLSSQGMRLSPDIPTAWYCKPKVKTGPPRGYARNRRVLSRYRIFSKWSTFLFRSRSSQNHLTLFLKGWRGIVVGRCRPGRVAKPVWLNSSVSQVGEIKNVESLRPSGEGLGG